MIENGFIQSQIKKYNVRLLVFTLVLIIALAAVLMRLPVYWDNLNNGPFQMDTEDLNEIEDVDSLDQYYVTVEGADVYTFIEDSGFLLLDMNDGILAIKGDADTDSIQFTGELKNLSDDDLEVLYDALSEKVDDMSAFDSAFYPVYLQVGNFGTSRTLDYGILLVLLLIIVRNVIQFVKRSNNPGLHPVCKYLSSYGEIETMVRLIDCEVDRAECDVKRSTVIVTESWVIAKRWFKLEFMPLSDVVWTYQKITSHRVNYIIPTGKTYELIVFTKDGEKHEMTVRNGVSGEELVTAIGRNAPWAFVGFSVTMEEKWKNNRKDFLQAVQDRFDQVKRYGEESLKEG